eukprot:g1215.t1
MSFAPSFEHLQRLRVLPVAPHVLHVELHRPEKMNALDLDTSLRQMATHYLCEGAVSPPLYGNPDILIWTSQIGVAVSL